MNRIIVAFGSDANRRRMCEMLEAGSVVVRSVCRSGAEVIRRLHEMGGGIVVCGYRLSDMTATDLAFSLDGSAYLLVVAPPEQLGFCEGENLFRLPTPTTRADVLASVRMLEQLEEMELRKLLPQRDAQEKELIARAKQRLIETYLMTEPEAHRYLQRKSMESGVRMADMARKILETIG